MATVKLEFEKLEILLEKHRWKLYFVIVAEHPADNDKMLLTTLPATGQTYFMLKKHSENVVEFVPESTDGGVEGLTILEREMPADRSLKVRMFLKHSRSSERQIGNILKNVESGLGGQAFGLVSDILGSTSSWLVIAKSTFGLIGGILNSINDRDMGYLSMDEDFEEEFDQKKELQRSNKTTTGDARLTWSWKIRN
jgi:hypothetical protein